MFGRSKDKTPKEVLEIEYSDSDDGKLIIRLSGKMDVISSKDLQDDAPAKCKGRDVILDVEELTYMSSAGIRAILVINRAVGKGNKLSVINANGYVKEVLDMSGLSDIL